MIMRWEGATLHISLKTETPTGQYAQTATMRVSADSKVLTREVEITRPGGVNHQRQVYDRRN
jgi:uncharacterized protein YcnI